MVPRHIRDALAQVRDVQQIVLDGQRFKGYSGRARALAGSLALVASAVMASSRFPVTVTAHLYGWGAVFLAGVLLNYGAMVHNFLYSPHIKRNWRRLRPTLDAFPSLFVGGILTLTFVRLGAVDLLFGMWMCLFGVTCLATRHVLPRICWIVGVFYICCGTGYLLAPHPSFLNPWPMGIVFFVGEWLGWFTMRDRPVRIEG